MTLKKKQSERQPLWGLFHENDDPSHTVFVKLVSEIRILSWELLSTMLIAK